MSSILNLRVAMQLSHLIFSFFGLRITSIISLSPLPFSTATKKVFKTLVLLVEPFNLNHVHYYPKSVQYGYHTATDPIYNHKPICHISFSSASGLASKIQASSLLVRAMHHTSSRFFSDGLYPCLHLRQMSSSASSRGIHLTTSSIQLASTSTLVHP